MLSTATDQGRALLDACVTQQATVIAYDNDFKLLMMLTLIAMPLVLRASGIVAATDGQPAGGAQRDGIHAHATSAFDACANSALIFSAVLAERRHRAVLPRLARPLRRRRRIGQRPGRRADVDAAQMRMLRQLAPAR